MSRVAGVGSAWSDRLVSLLTSDPLLAGIAVAAGVFLPLALLASPLGFLLSVPTTGRTRSEGIASSILGWFKTLPIGWTVIGWFVFFVVVPVAVMFELFALVSPFLLIPPIAEFVRFDFEEDKSMDQEPIFAVAAAFLSPLLLVPYGFLGGIEYGLRRIATAAIPISAGWPAPPGAFVGNWSLVAFLGTVPVVGYAVATIRRARGADSAAGETESNGFVWTSIPVLAVNGLLVAGAVIVPLVCYVTLGVVSPAIVVLLGIVSMGRAFDRRRLRRRCLGFALVVPLAIPSAFLESALRATLLG